MTYTIHTATTRLVAVPDLDTALAALHAIARRRVVRLTREDGALIAIAGPWWRAAEVRLTEAEYRGTSTMGKQSRRSRVRAEAWRAKRKAKPWLAPDRQGNGFQPTGDR